jgi:hypothetical protein
VDTKLQGGIFVRVAKLLHRHFLGCICRILVVIEVRALVDLNKLTAASTAAVNPHVNWQRFRTHAHASSLHIIDVSPRHLKISFFI